MMKWQLQFARAYDWPRFCYDDSDWLDEQPQTQLTHKQSHPIPRQLEVKILYTFDMYRFSSHPSPCA